MIRVRVELISAITGKTTELARMHIINDGTGTKARGNYDVEILRSRGGQLNNHIIQKRGRVVYYPRLGIHVWNLVSLALANLEYGVLKR